MVEKMVSARRMAFVALALGCLIGCNTNSTPGPAGDGSTGANAGDKRRIILLTNGYSDFWKAAETGLQAAAKDFGLAAAGLEATFMANDGTNEGQLDKLRQIATQSDVAAVGISVTDRDNVAIADELRALRKKGVKVIAIDSDLNENLRDARYAFVGSNNLAGGRLLGTAARLLRPDGGEYVTFVGRTGAHNAIQRVDGFAEGAGKNFVAKDNMGDEIDMSKAKENVRNAIRNHPDLKFLVGIWSYNAGKIVDVVQDQNARDKFTIVCFDADQDAIQHTEAGLIDVLVVQNPYRMGYDGVRLMKALIEDDQAVLDEMLHQAGVDGDRTIDTGLKVVIPDDDSPLTADQFGDDIEFFKLKDFRLWLDKYGLKSS
ncbi:MAG: substrate-binding domain-containing protein [Pirellulales bacterium]